MFHVFYLLFLLKHVLNCFNLQIFYFYLFLLVLSHVVYEHGIEYRRPDKKASLISNLLQIPKPCSQDYLMTCQLRTLTSYCHITELSKIKQKLKIRWQFFRTDFATGFYFHLEYSLITPPCTMQLPELVLIAEHLSHQLWSCRELSICPLVWFG